MSEAVTPKFVELDLDKLKSLKGEIAVFVDADGKLDRAARKLNTLTKGAIARATQSEAFEKAKQGSATRLAMPVGIVANAVVVVKLDKKADVATVRKAGAALTKSGNEEITIATTRKKNLVQLAFGAAMRRYSFDARKSSEPQTAASITVMCSNPKDLQDNANTMDAVAQGVFFTRDLVNEPANFLTTSEFARRLVELESLGLKATVLDEDEMSNLGMGSLLGVGQGSESPSKIVILEWNGGKKGEAPFALVGKGVVFDTGGISLKPAGGMEDMTMDMGGAGVVAGVMKTLALRKANANVVGLVGLVENMPDAKAQRPGDVVTSMKGDTIEVINTDAEGRLVLADVLWYAQKTYKPQGVINLATLTGAIIIGLGHENAGAFSNDDGLCNDFLAAANTEAEGAWRMPLGQAYDDMLKSRIADMKNVGGRAAGSITAAQFLQRFIEDGMPWIHLDIAGVASVKTETALAPKGATGWGVMALNRLIQDKYES